MTDVHIHVGWYIDGYHSPDDVTISLRNVGVERIVVSSTSTCAEEYDLVIREMVWLQEEWGKDVFPFLWVTPKMLESGGIHRLIDSGICWKGIKLHFVSHPEFYYNPELILRLFEMEYFRGKPVLIHTGEYPTCHASVFERIIAGHKDRIFILAHGRPLDEAAFLVSKHENAYVDTAFMPEKDIVQLLRSGLEDKVLWGSDLPINTYVYPRLRSERYLEKRIGYIRKHTDSRIFIKLTDTNFNKIMRSSPE